MNTERLHAIALALQEDLKATDSVSLMGQLTQQLHAQVQAPAQPDHQVQAASSREQLVARLAEAPSNDFSPAWVQALEELGVAGLLGNLLRERVEGILERNEITVESAANELDEISSRLQEFASALDKLMESLDFFEIGAEELDPGEYEVGFLIPRDALDNELAHLGRELVKLHDILDPFLELGTGTRPDLVVRSLSTSWFQVFLDSPGPTAASFAVAVERVVALYKSLLEIRLAQEKLKAAGVPDEKTVGIKEHATEHMASGIEEAVEDLLKQYGQNLEEGRTNELRKALRHSLNAVANRIDKGYNVEVRAGELPETEEDAEPEDEAAQKTRAVTEAIAAKQAALRFMNLTGKPILELPEGDGALESGGDKPEKGES